MLSSKEYFNRGVDKLRKRDWDGAIEDFSEAIELNLEYEEAWNGSGAAKLMKKEVDDAIKDFDLAIVINPKFEQAWYNRGLAKTEAHDLAGAIKDFSKAIEIRPDYVKAWSDRGVAKAKNNNLDGAIEDFGQAIVVNPDYMEAWYNRGYAKAEKSDYLDDAIKDFEQVLKLKPNLLEDLYTDYVQKFGGIFLLLRRAVLELYRVLIENARSELDKSSPMHYTNLHALLNLAQRKKFRLYSYEGMNDSEEGNIILNWFKEEQREKISEILKTSGGIDTYIASFVIDSDPESGDDLMWRTYGKHENVERAGCALVIEEEYLQPPDPAHFEFIDKVELGRKLSTQDEIGGFYPVCYGMPSGRIQGKICELGKVLERIGASEDPEMYKMAADLLNYVRYLFKHKTHKREREFRLIKHLPSGSGEEDVVNAFREYTESSLCMKKVTVLLGPSVGDKEELEQYLSEKDVFKEIKSIDS